jgi:hypothetical protein
MEMLIKKNWLAACMLAGLGIISLVLGIYSVAIIGKQMELKQAFNDLHWVGLALHQYHAGWRGLSNNQMGGIG